MKAIPFLFLRNCIFLNNLYTIFPRFVSCYWSFSFRCCFLEAAAESAHLKTNDGCSPTDLFVDSVTRTSKQNPLCPVSKDNIIQ